LRPPFNGLKQTRWRIVMPKYLFQATYTAEGIKGLEKDKAAGRKAALRACQPIGESGWGGEA